ncbi:FAR1 DNA-binding domain [Sesbania bispinosa]|nr:FAR1 DNA-binding domain [Sesbania bispinosa]
MDLSDSDVSSESTNAEDEECHGGIEVTSINNVANFANVKWKKLNQENFVKHDFANRELAFKFYNWYARVKGFSARKDRTGKKGEVIVRSTFVCYRMGEHKVPSEGYKREPKRIMRCGCKAHCKVRLNLETHRWHVKELFDQHNHEMLDERFQGMLPRHRRMDVSELMQMNDMRDAGIGTPSIYQALANQCGGFDRVGFRVRDMYNEIVKQRKNKKNDANEALLYLERLATLAKKALALNLQDAC